MPLEIDPIEIKRLDPRQLVLLMRKLIYHEAEVNGILAADVRASASINVPDGGEDGRVTWRGGLGQTNWFPRRDCLFQSKAQHVTPAICGGEVLDSQGNIKRMVAQIVASSGAYLLFCSHQSTGQAKDECTRAIRESLRLPGASQPNVEIRIYGADEIARWVNTVPAAGAMVRQFLNLAHALTAQDWRTWEGLDAHQGAYQSTELLTGQVDAIREALAVPKSVVRLVGLSGLGKTRLALEAFRPPTNPEANAVQQALSESVVYASEPTTDLKDYIHSVATAGKRAVFVVDECSDDEHRKLSELVRRQGSATSLLTLDHAGSEPPSGDEFVRLEKQPKEVIRGIISERHSNLSGPFMDQVCDYADGFPQIAVLLVDAGLAGEVLDVGATLGTRMTSRLLYGRQAPDHQATALIRSLAIFDYVGFSQGVRKQFEFVVAKLWRQPNMDATAAEQLLRDRFFRRQLIQPKGRYIRVTPYPLAVALAQDWWEACPQGLVDEIFSGVLPDELVESMCRRFKLMGVVERARELVGTLCGANGPFGRRERLRTKVGSRLLEAMAEVNPLPVLNALQRAFGTADATQLLELESAPRRSIVRILELLAWWPDTFVGAATLLLSFAEAETESWANNATGVFRELFKPYMSGTEATFLARLPVIDSALGSGSEKRQTLALDAMSRWFDAGPWMRHGGPDQQGARVPRLDWQPPSKEEHERCVREVLARVRRFEALNSAIGVKAREVLASAVFRLVQWGWLEDVKTIIREVSRSVGEPWVEARRVLEHQLAWESKLTEEERGFVQQMATELQPRSLTARLQQLVARAGPMRMRKIDGGGFEDLNEIRAKELAIELAREVDTFVGHASTLMEGEQGYAGSFGASLCRTVGDPYQTFLRLLEVYRQLPRENRNPSLFMGMMVALDEKDYVSSRKILDLVAIDDGLISVLPALTRACRIHSEDLDRILLEVVRGRIAVGDLWNGPNGVVLRHLDARPVCAYFDRVAAIDANGALLAVDGYQMYLHQQTPEKRAAAKLSVRTLVLRPELMELALDRGNLAQYALQGLIEFSLEDSASNGEFVRSIVRRLLVAAAEDRHRLDEFARNVAFALLKHAKEIALPELISSVTEQNQASWRLRHALGNVGFSKREAVLDAVSDDELWAAAQASAAHAVVVASLISPLAQTVADRDPTYSRWSKLCIRFLGEFGSSEKVLDAIGHELGSVGWSGSGVLVYTERLEACRQLNNHPNLNVRKWAAEEAAYFERRVEDEKRNDEEEEFRVR